MRNLNEEPRNSGPLVWLMAVLIIAIAAKVDTTTADIVILALTGYTMHPYHSRQ